MNAELTTMLSDKAERFDQLILNAQFEYDFFSKLLHAIPREVRDSSKAAAFYEGYLHAITKTLWYAGAPVAQCTCASCTEKRMRGGEAVDGGIESSGYRPEGN